MDDDSTGNDFDGVAAVSNHSNIERSAATIQLLDDTANVRHILGETVITTPNLMVLLDGKLSDWGRECINAWNKSLDIKDDSEVDNEGLTELYERAIDVYGSAALFDADIMEAILSEIDVPPRQGVCCKVARQ